MISVHLNYEALDIRRILNMKKKKHSTENESIRTTRSKSANISNGTISSSDSKDNIQASGGSTSDNKNRQNYERQHNEVKELPVTIKNNSNKRKCEKDNQTETKKVSMYNHVAQDLIITVDPETKGAIHKLLITKLSFVLKT